MNRKVIDQEILIRLLFTVFIYGFVIFNVRKIKHFDINNEC
jgi:hypothetical protein